MSGMFLSRARLRADSSVRALAPLLLPDGPAALMADHRLVWSLMSDDPDRQRDFLWRREGKGVFLILAPRPADDRSALFDVDSKPWAPELRAGDRLGFLLRANPTVAHPLEHGKRGQRRGVVADALARIPRAERAEQRHAVTERVGQAWLAAQGARHGFELERLRVDGDETVTVPRAGSRSAEFQQLEFEGVLSVTNPAVLVQGVADGIGRAKAFGCGLMLLRRA